MTYDELLDLHMDRDDMVPWEYVGMNATWEDVEEAMRDSGTDFEVEVLPMMIARQSDPWIVRVPGCFATVTDDGTVLGTVGERYHLYQNHDVFCPMQSIVDAGGKIKCAGVTDKYTSFMVAMLPIHDDEFDFNVVATNSFDRSSKVRMFVVPVERVEGIAMPGVLHGFDNMMDAKHCSGNMHKVRLKIDANVLASEVKKAWDRKRKLLEQILAPCWENIYDRVFPIPSHAAKNHDKAVQRVKDMRSVFQEAYAEMHRKKYGDSTMACAMAYYDYISHCPPHKGSCKKHRDIRLNKILWGTATDPKVVRDFRL